MGCDNESFLGVLYWSFEGTLEGPIQVATGPEDEMQARLCLTCQQL